MEAKERIEFQVKHELERYIEKVDEILKKIEEAESVHDRVALLIYQVDWILEYLVNTKRELEILLQNYTRDEIDGMSPEKLDEEVRLIQEHLQEHQQFAKREQAVFQHSPECVDPINY